VLRAGIRRRSAAGDRYNALDHADKRDENFNQRWPCRAGGTSPSGTAGAVPPFV